MKMASPLDVTFDWGDDLVDSKSKSDVFDPFVMESNDGSLVNSEPLNNFTSGAKYDLKLSMEDFPQKRRFSANASHASETSGTISRRKKKPKGMPKRPLSAYNLYFQSERSKIQEAALGAGEKIGFEGLGKIIGKKWRELSAVEREVYGKLAEKDTVRYLKEMEAYNDLKAKRVEEEDRPSSLKPIAEVGMDRNIDELQASAVEPNVFFARMPEPSSCQPLDPFVMDAATQPVPISSREEFSRLHAMIAPMPSSAQYGQGPQQLQRTAPTLYASHYDCSIPHGSHRVSMPPPPNEGERVAIPNSFQMPPGLEIVLTDRSGQDRKYCVQYACYSMTRDAAWKYIDSFTGAAANKKIRLSHPQILHQQQPQVPMMESSVPGEPFQR